MACDVVASFCECECIEEKKKLENEFQSITAL